jgi:hypothetical protein
MKQKLLLLTSMGALVWTQLSSSLPPITYSTKDEMLADFMENGKWLMDLR